MCVFSHTCHLMGKNQGSHNPSDLSSSWLNSYINAERFGFKCKRLPAENMFLVQCNMEEESLYELMRFTNVFWLPKQTNLVLNPHINVYKIINAFHYNHKRFVCHDFYAAFGLRVSLRLRCIQSEVSFLFAPFHPLMGTFYFSANEMNFETDQGPKNNCWFRNRASSWLKHLNERRNVSTSRELHNMLSF